MMCTCDEIFECLQERGLLIGNSKAQMYPSLPSNSSDAPDSVYVDLNNAFGWSGAYVATTAAVNAMPGTGQAISWGGAALIFAGGGIVDFLEAAHARRQWDLSQYSEEEMEILRDQLIQDYHSQLDSLLQYNYPEVWQLIQQAGFSHYNAASFYESVLDEEDLRNLANLVAEGNSWPSNTDFRLSPVGEALYPLFVELSELNQFSPQALEIMGYSDTEDYVQDPVETIMEEYNYYPTLGSDYLRVFLDYPYLTSVLASGEFRNESGSLLDLIISDPSLIETLGQSPLLATVVSDILASPDVVELIVSQIIGGEGGSAQFREVIIAVVDSLVTDTSSQLGQTLNRLSTQVAEIRTFLGAPGADNLAFTGDERQNP